MELIKRGFRDPVNTCFGDVTKDGAIEFAVQVGDQVNVLDYLFLSYGGG